MKSAVKGRVVPLGNLVRGIRDALVGTIKGVGDVVGTTVEITRETTLKGLQGARGIAKEAAPEGSIIRQCVFRFASETMGTP